MKHFFNNLKPYWLSVIFLALLLIVQAFGEISMPEYTQNIIDVGIQNHGIEHILPEKISDEDYSAAMVFMNDSEKEKWESSYTKKENTYELSEKSDKKLTELDSELLLPVVMSYQINYVDSDEAKQMRAAAEAGKQTPEVIAAIREKISDSLDASGEQTLKAMGVRFAYESDEKAGVDVESIQTVYLWKSGARILGMALLMMAAAVAVSFIASKVGAGIGRDLRIKVFKNVIGYSSSEMDKFETSSLITRATNDVQQVQMVTIMMLRMVLYAPVLGIWGVIKVYNTHANMSYIIVLGIAVISAMIFTLVGITMPKFKAMQKLVDKVNGVSREILTGLMVIRAFGRQNEEEKRFDKANTDLMRTQLFVNRIMSLMMPGMMLIMNGLAILITWVAAHRVDSGTLQVGAMTAFITYAMMIISSFMIITAMSIMLPRAGVAADRIEEVISTRSSVNDPENAVKIADKKGLIEFDHVSFRYPGAEDDVIHDITFTAKPSETTAIIGSTGSGKSTLVNLIPRFYDVTEGEIRLDGTDIRKLSLHDLRDEIGFVPQKGTLFFGTIESNIRFGVPDAPEVEMKRAAAIAQASDFIEEKEDKYNSHISQGGNNVSGGQKQRLSIARALIKRPNVLVFDDSFSALDMKTDAKLRAVLAEEEKNTNKIIVAQRISTILHSDQIIVLDEGRIAGKGTHSELMKNCEVYRQIAYSQLSEKELEATENG